MYLTSGSQSSNGGGGTTAATALTVGLNDQLTSGQHHHHHLNHSQIQNGGGPLSVTMAAGNNLNHGHLNHHLQPLTSAIVSATDDIFTTLKMTSIMEVKKEKRIICGIIISFLSSSEDCERMRLVNK